MKDKDKTREQLINELAELRQQVAEPEALETEHRLAEEKIKQNQKELETLLDSLPEIVFYKDTRDRLLRCNKGFTIALGMSRDEVLGKTTDDLFPEHAENMKRDDREIIESGQPKIGIIEPYDTPQGIRWAQTSKIPIRDKDNKVTGLIGIATDITERKRAEEALLESEERYRSLVNLGGAVGEAIVMLQDTEQGEGIQTFVSKEWPRITGYPEKKLLGMSFFDLLHPRYHDAALERHKRRMRGETIPQLFELSIIRKDGTKVPIEATSAYTTYRGERANVVFIRDITERKQAEEREKHLREELHFSSRLAAIGQLAAGVAHEINNPLTGILGYSELLLRKSADENTRKGLEIIHNAAQRMAKIVENLTTFARRHQPKKEYVDINEIIKEALGLRAYELKTGNIEVALDLASDLPQTMSDFHQIQEVFLNLILNAEQAITEAHRGGKLIIKTKQLKNRVIVSFADDGPGIPDEILNKLFDPFLSTRGEKGGTGLGLSICHGIVTEHEGKIYARSKPGKGATFFVELPVTT